MLAILGRCMCSLDARMTRLTDSTRERESHLHSDGACHSREKKTESEKVAVPPKSSMCSHCVCGSGIAMFRSQHSIPHSDKPKQHVPPISTKKKRTKLLDRNSVIKPVLTLIALMLP